MIDDHEIIERMKVTLAMIFMAAVAAAMFCMAGFLFYVIRIGLVDETGGLYGHVIWAFCVLIFILPAGCGIHYAITGRGLLRARPGSFED